MTARPGPAASLGVALVLGLGVAACSSSSTTSTATTAGPATTAVGGGTGTTIDPFRNPDALSHGSTPGEWCASEAPGVPVPAEKAVVRFDRTQICPGYVTVTTGTKVGWNNLDSVAHTVTVTRTVGGKDVLDQQSVAPGATWTRAFPDAGSFGYTTDAIPSFQGTVEVQGPGGASGHGA